MEANIKEFDVNKNFIVEVPSGEAKVEIATTIAIANGYQEFIPKSEPKQVVLTAAELSDLITDLGDNATNLRSNIISDTDSADKGKFEVSYVDNTPEINPKSAVEFGLTLGKAALGNLYKRSKKQLELQAIRAEQSKILQDTERAIVEGIDASFNGLNVE